MASYLPNVPAMLMLTKVIGKVSSNNYGARFSALHVA